MSSSAIDIFGNQVDNFKNKIINGNFDFWQRMRGTTSAWTFSLTGSSITSYVADRWFITANANGGDQYVLSAERKAFAAGQSKILSLPKCIPTIEKIISANNTTPINNPKRAFFIIPVLKDLKSIFSIIITNKNKTATAPT